MSRNDARSDPRVTSTLCTTSVVSRLILRRIFIRISRYLPRVGDRAGGGGGGSETPPPLRPKVERPLRRVPYRVGLIGSFSQPQRRRSLSFSLAWTRSSSIDIETALSQRREHLPFFLLLLFVSAFLRSRVSIYAVYVSVVIQSLLPRGECSLSSVSLFLYLSVLCVITCDRAARGSTRSAVDRAIAAPGFAMGPDPVAVDLAVLAAEAAAASSLHQ